LLDKQLGETAYEKNHSIETRTALLAIIPGLLTRFSYTGAVEASPTATPHFPPVLALADAAAGVDVAADDVVLRGFAAGAV